MNRTRVLIAFIAFPLLGYIHADTWPEEASVGMGLAKTAPGNLDLRIWVGGGVLSPFFLYRIRTTGAGVVGEVIAWAHFNHSDDPGNLLRKKVWVILRAGPWTASVSPSS